MAIERRNPNACCWLCEPGKVKRRELREKAQRREDQDMRSRLGPTRLTPAQLATVRRLAEKADPIEVDPSRAK